MKWFVNWVWHICPYEAMVELDSGAAGAVALAIGRG